MPAFKLPFDKIAPGTFNSAFPKSATTGLPAAHQGVETQAKLAKPAPPMLNTDASDRVAALGRNPAIPPAPMPRLPDSIIGGGSSPPRLAPRMPGTEIGEPRNPLGGVSPVSPLGGMPTSSLSGRGGPMSYAPKGVGTTNPNAYAVGQNNKGFRLRTGTDSPSAPRLPRFPGSILAGESPAVRMPQLPESVVSSAPRLPWQLPGSPIAQPAQPSAPMPGRDDEFWQQQDQLMGDFWKDQKAQEMQRQTDEAKAAEAEAKKGFSLQPLDPMNPGRGDAIVRGDGSLFNILAGQKPEPAPMTADDIAAARSMGGDVSVPLPGGGQVNFPAQTQAKPAMIKIFDTMNQRVMDFPDGYELPKGFTALTKKGETAAPKPEPTKDPAKDAAARTSGATPTGIQWKVK